MRDLVDKERREAYESKMKELCQVYNQKLEVARICFQEAKRKARRKRDEAINELSNELHKERL